MQLRSLKRTYHSSPVSVFAMLSLLLVANPGHSAELEEVIVTAQKRTQSAQDIGLSVSAFDAEDALRFANDIGALAGQSPGVEAYGTGTYLQSFFIRGIGLNEFSGNFNAPVAIHNDEVYVSKNWMTARPTFDIERIEILKGPQGTVFGRNTTGGAVNYYTAAPDQEFSGHIRANGDEYSRYSLEGAITGSLGENLAGRFSFYRGFGNGGPQDNLFTGEEHGEPDITEVRGQLQWDLDNTRVRVLVYGGTDDSETLGYKNPGIFSDTAPGFCPQAITGAVIENPATCPRFAGITGIFNMFTEAEFAPNDIFTINQNHAPIRNDSFSGGYVRVEHDFANVTFTSLTSIDQYERQHREDSDGTPIASNDLDFFSDIDVFTQEFRLTGSANDDRINYVAGIFYEADDLRQVDSLELTENPFNLVGAGLPPRLVGQLDQEVDSIAAFFNLDYALTDDLVLTIGARYTEDETTLVAETSAGLNDVQGEENLPQTTLAVIDTADDSRTDTDFSWRLGLAYDFNDSTLLYGNLATGFRTGGYSVPFGGTIVEFEPEELFSLELGIKTDISDTLRLNAATFFYQYEDLQVNVDDPVSPIVPITRNIGESESFGVELEVTWLASENIEIGLGYSYLDAEFTETDRQMTTISTLGPIPLEGNTPVNSPENQFNGSFQYANQLGNDWIWSTYLAFRWVDDRFLEVTNQPADAADAYTVIDANFGLVSVDGTWEFSLWARNLTNEEYVTYINNLPGPGFKLDIWGEQRAIGATLGYRF